MYAAAVLFVMAGVGSISSAINAPSSSVRINNFIFGVAYLVTAVLTIAAVSTERSILLFPYLIAEILLLFFAVSGLILVLKQLFKEGGFNNTGTRSRGKGGHDKDMHVFIAFIGGYIFSVLLNVFGLILGVKCFWYLKEKNG